MKNVEPYKIFSKEQKTFIKNGIKYVQGSVVSCIIPSYKEGNLEWFYMYKEEVYIGRIHSSEIVD